MRKIIVNALLGGIVGGILGNSGVPIQTWEFWVIMACLIATQINSDIA